MIKKYFPPILWMAVIFVLSSIPGSIFPKRLMQNFAWLVHLVEYFILGLLWYRALPKKTFVILVIGILYAVSDETHQIFVPFREFSILDMVIDTTGVAVGIVIGRRLWP